MGKWSRRYELDVQVRTTLCGNDLRVIRVNAWFTVLSPHTCWHLLQQVRGERVQGKVIEDS